MVTGFMGPRRIEACPGRGVHGGANDNSSNDRAPGQGWRCKNAGSMVKATNQNQHKIWLAVIPTTVHQCGWLRHVSAKD